MTLPNSNKGKLDAAVARWIAEASARGPAGAPALRSRVEWMDAQLADLAKDEEPEHLQGLTVWDLQEGARRLAEAARELEK